MAKSPFEKEGFWGDLGISKGKEFMPKRYKAEKFSYATPGCGGRLKLGAGLTSPPQPGRDLPLKIKRPAQSQRVDITLVAPIGL